MVICAISTSCDDDIRDVEEVVGVEEPIDLEVRLERIDLSETIDGTPTSSIAINYDANQRIDAVVIEGGSSFQMTYAANNRLVAIEETGGGITKSTALIYDNNTITARSTASDGSQQEKILRIDLQNRIDRAITYDLNSAGNRTEVRRLQYLYTENFNVSRINDLSANGNTVLGYTEFTYVFNNNPFRDMNDVIRFLIFDEFVPYTRYLPATQRDYERVGGSFIESRSTVYTYQLQEDQFPSSRAVETTTAAGTQTNFEFFIYQP
ncbi:hypothetical protein NMS_1180 [Nonlabens marinus S1-08]|uniref:DUF4595 domain-containing protein n=2 Tax=Nonlabens TaxID=363408 RepID=W8VPR8_9FLAO|nr:hypothetical protein NMS_1180 [Nonlabens marinus S1-08]